MAAADISLEFTLNLPDGDKLPTFFDAQSIYAVEITEHLSDTYRACAKFITADPVPVSDLSRLPGTQIRIKLGHKGHTRYLQGQILSYRSNGVISHTKAGKSEKYSCSYELTIGSALDFIPLTPRYRAFYQGMPGANSGFDASPPSVIKAILDEHKVTNVETSNTNLMPAGYFAADLILEQNGESDPDFIHRLCTLYGMNYAFVHSQDGFAPKLYFSRGNTLYSGTPVGSSGTQTAENSNPTNLSAVLKCLIGRSGRTDDQQEQIDDLTWYEDRKSKKAPARATFSSYFSAGSSGYGYGEASDAYRIAQNSGSAAAGRDLLFRGSSQTLQILPGRVLEFGSLYDTKASAAGSDGSKTSVLVTSSTLLLQISPPEDRLSEADLQISPKIAVSFEAVAFNSERSPGSFAPVPAAGNHSLWFEQELVEAVVCDDKGSTDSSGTRYLFPGDDARRPLCFFALPQVNQGTKDGPLVATMVNLSGSEQNWTAEFPRVGQKVLLIPVHGRFYLHSYLHTDADKIAYADYPHSCGHVLKRWSAPVHGSGKTAGAALELVEYLAATDTQSSDSAAVNSANKQLIQDKSYRDFMLSRGELLKKQLSFTANDKRIRSDYDSANSESKNIATLNTELHQAFASLNAAGIELRNARVSAFKNNWPDDGVSPSQTTSAADDSSFKQAVSSYESAVDSFTSKADTLAEKLRLTYPGDKKDGKDVTYAPPAKILLSLNSEGDIEISAPDGNLSFYAKNISFTATEQLNATAKQMTQVADGKATISGKISSVTLSESTTIDSRKWMDLSSLSGSKMILDPLAGITVKAPSFAVQAVYTALMKDAFGASVTAGRGTVALDGATVVAKTTNKTSAIRNMIQAASDIIGDSMDAINHSLVQSTEWKNIINEFKIYSAKGLSLWALIEKEIQIFKNDDLQVWQKVIQTICEITAYVADLTVSILKFSVLPRVDDQDTQESIQESIDWITFSADMIKTGSVLTTLVPTYVALISGVKDDMTVKLDPGNFMIKGAKAQVLTRQYENSNSVLAGVAVNPGEELPKPQDGNIQKGDSKYWETVEKEDKINLDEVD